MKTYPRLTLGQDLRPALEAAVQSQNCRGAFVLSGIGSLPTAGLRFAGSERLERGDFWATTSNKQLNFLRHIKTLLKQHGRAAVVLPDYG
jgi:predicted DNA-binding protein with PD1-like motif